MLKTLQVKELSISTSQEQPEEVAKILSKYKEGDRVPIEIRQIEVPENPESSTTNMAVYVENVRVGTTYKESAQLPVGTNALVTIPKPEAKAFIATTRVGLKIEIKDFKNYSEFSADERAALVNEQQKITFDYIKARSSKVSRNSAALVAKINNRILGLVGNNRQVEGKLSELGVRQVKGFSFNASVEPRVTAYLSLTIEPESVVYPKIWQRRYSEPILKENNNIKNVRAGGEPSPEFKPILFEKKSHPYKNGDTTEYRPVIGITSEKSQLPIIEDWLKARGVLTQKPGEYTQTELSLNAETILVDPRSLNEAVKVELINNFGRILDASTPEISITNNLSDPIYYLDKNQKFTNEDTGEITIAPSWSIVVHNNEAELVDAWLKQKELHPLTLVEKEENITTFVVKDIYTRDRIRLELMQAFGEPIDVATEAGYERYSENYEKLDNANVTKPEVIAVSEYQTQLENLTQQPIPAVVTVVDVPVLNRELETVSFPSSSEANKNTSLEILGKISSEKVAQLRSHLETHYKPLLANDKSNYAPGRKIAWVAAEWGLKDKDFKPAVQDDKLMELILQVYPDAELALVTLSSQQGQGIGYHRDDSYANADARSINIGDAEWGYQTAKQSMVAYDPKEDRTTPIVESKLDSGTITRFNSKNAHAALHTEAERWSINIWSVKNNERAKFEQFQASNQPPRAIVQSSVDLTIKNNEWTPGGEIQVLRTFDSITEAIQNDKTPATAANIKELIEFGNRTATRAAAPKIPHDFTISGRPVPMNYELHNFNEAPQVPVNTTIEAMRGHGRVHTTRGVDYEKAYGIKSGDIVIAAGKNGEKVAFRVGKQYEITPEMIKDPNYQKAWADWEKHSPKELTQNQAGKGKIYGLFIEPLGDYANGKITPFPQQAIQPLQRERWEQNLINESFNALKQNPENIGVKIQTAPFGKSTITFDTETQTLAITNSSNEKIYECKRGEVATISNLNQQQQDYFSEEIEPLKEIQPLQRERWEENLINESFNALKQNPENIGVKIQTAPFGKSTITFDTSTQTLAITNSTNEKIYQSKRGEVATISNLSPQQQEYFNKLTKAQIEK
jgi:hypothetical protein